MAQSWTYNTLIAALDNWLQDNSTDFTTALPEIVALGEQRLYGDLNLSFLDSTESLTITQGTATITKPTGWVATLNVWYTTSGDAVLMYPRTLDFVKDYNPDPTDEGLPLYYAENTDTTWLVAPTPNFTGTGQARVVKYPTALSLANQSTWLGTNAGDALWYSCLIAAEQFLKTDMDKPERIQMWQKEYGNSVSQQLRNMAASVRAVYTPGQM